MCSSNKEWNTTAAAPASSMSLTLSRLSLSGEADGTSGVRSFMPKYCVERFMLLHSLHLASRSWQVAGTTANARPPVFVLSEKTASASAGRDLLSILKRFSRLKYSSTASFGAAHALPHLSQCDFGLHIVRELVVVKRKAQLLTDSLHPVIIRQNVPYDAFQYFLAADIPEQLQEVSPKPLPLQRVTDYNGELGFVDSMNFN